ncbi:hypothetical protein MES4922_110213 [Mesorhizobium ventifaucium]|uniref:Uncharacterized protein n=1 Tax=Mesorhizobium ventifaucium TaxID=666020 RepID=A0ABM9DF15_9HYPH|nr:hypothetical protein MES4922_110213 [Mesorhizobium ventifaucium]
MAPRDAAVAIAFKPSLFQAFFRAEREVFRLFQRRERFPRGLNSELPESRGNPPSFLGLDGETGVRDQPRWLARQMAAPGASPSVRQDAFAACSGI